MTIWKNSSEWCVEWHVSVAPRGSVGIQTSLSLEYILLSSSGRQSDAQEMIVHTLESYIDRSTP